MGKMKETWKPRKRPLQRRSQKTVDYVLEAATQLFVELGYEQTTTNHIAEKAGVSIGSLYQYFPNKQSLLLVLAEHHLSEVREKATATLRGLREEGVSPEKFFRGFAEFVVDFHQGEESLHALFFEEAPSSSRLVELVAAINAGCAWEIEQYLRERNLAGDDPSLKAAMLAGMAGNLTHELALDPPTGHTSAAYQEEIVRACLAYLGTPQAPR